MRMQGLSTDTIPPIHIPFRFFHTAPWMGVVAALVLLFGSDNAISSQWSPELLGITHLLTLGFMAMVMVGAMFQLVPVISGHLIPGGVVVATLVHLLLLAGMLLLVAGFVQQQYHWFGWAVPLLLLAFTILLLAVGSLLLRRIGGGDAIFSMRFAILSLLITVGLGLLRAAAYTGLADLPSIPNVTTVHLAWGLGGWTMLLVMGVSYQVIPMFHVTPSYPTALARVLPTLVFCSLLLITLSGAVAAQAIAVACLCASASVYATYSIYLLSQRKRKIQDVTVWFWRLSLACLLLAALLLPAFYFGHELFAAGGLHYQMPVTLGVLMIVGFAGSVIMGMLQKIVPFLTYLHLQRRCLANFTLLKSLPHMGEIIPVSRSRWQFRLHIAALLSLLLAVTTGLLVDLAALLLAADFGWLGFTLTSASRLYRRTVRRIATAPVEAPGTTPSAWQDHHRS